MGTVLLAGSFSLVDIVHATPNRFIVPQFLTSLLFLIAGLVETRRLPFDLPEAVAGFHSEYSGMKIGMFFVGEHRAAALRHSYITVAVKRANN